MVRAGEQTGRIIAAAVAVVFLVAGVGVAPAAAHHDFTCAYHNETDFKNLPPGCRNFLIDPGVGNQLTRGHLMAHPELYGAQGISRQFLWYARETVMRVHKDQTVAWNSCAYRPGAGNACAPGSVISSTKTIGAAFGGTVDLTVLEHRGMFIGLACGNVRDDLPRHQRPDLPTPGISGAKFLDRDRDGARDGDEPGLGGWRIELHLVETWIAGFAPGKVAETTTAANGDYLFRLTNLPPGRYRVVEESRAGWAQTRQPADVIVNEGIGDHVVKGNDFGNVETVADVVKADFQLVDPPERLEADEPATLLVRATLRNDGPADVVDVTDTLVVTGPADCAILPRRQTVTRRLVEGQSVVVDLPVTMTCADPSNHPFVFRNDLAVTKPGVTDPDPADNHRTFTHIIPVFDGADIGVDDVVLDCDARSDVRVAFACTVTAAVSNAGPHPDALADVVGALELPADCTATSPDAQQPGVEVSDAAPTTVISNWTVTCAQRSFHPITARVDATLNQLHVEDLEPANNSATGATVVEIFEAADLAVIGMDIACGEHANTREFTCVTTTAVTNHGVAEAVRTRTVVDLAVPDGCVASGGPVTHLDELDTDEAARYTDSFTVACADAGRHVMRATAVIAADEPHAEDRALADNDGAIVWAPIDIKPRGFPNAVNTKQKGVIPVAVLSTAVFDAPSSVGASSLRFGATGTEPSLVRCAAPEDVNGDGLADLVCHFDATLTGFTCASTVGVLTGQLTDGTGFQSQDSVKPTPCKS